MGVDYREHIPKIAADDAKVVVEKDIQYGASWCKRGGAGAYMVMVRKSDRIEQRVEKYGYDIFAAVEDDDRVEGIIDDIRDLRGYLLLIEGWLIENRIVTPRYGVDSRCPHWSNPGTELQARCVKVVGHSGNCVFDNVPEYKSCQAQFNGFQCQLPTGHSGDHHSGTDATDIAWPEKPHNGDAHGRTKT